MNDRIRAVLWDLGGVLVRTEDTSKRRIWEKKHGMQPWDLERLVHRNPIAQQATLGEASPAEVWNHVAVALRLSRNELELLQADFYAGDVLDQKLIAAIEQLKATVKSGLITNAWSNVRHLIEESWAIDSLFDEILISAEVGLAKPDPRIYHLMRERLDLPLENMVFIDDFLENIQAADEVGMKTILFRSSEQTRIELEGRFGFVLD